MLRKSLLELLEWGGEDGGFLFVCKFRWGRLLPLTGEDEISLGIFLMLTSGNNFRSEATKGLLNRRPP